MAASAGGVVSSGVGRSRQMGSMGLSGATGGGCGGSRDRSSDSNGHNTDDETVLSGGEDDENGSNDHNVQGSDRDGKNKARKNRTVEKSDKSDNRNRKKDNGSIPETKRESIEDTKKSEENH